MRFCRVVKSTLKGYQASCEQIFRVLVVWNFVFADSWNQRFKVPREECKNFLPFWGLKMRFYLFVKSTFQVYQAACLEFWRMYQASCEEIFCILAVWKCDCCRFVKLTYQCTSQRVGIFMFEAWKCDFAQSWNQRFKGTKFRGINFSATPKLRVNKLSAFCLPENAISAN